MTVYDRDLIDALCRHVIGKPALACDRRDLLRVRDITSELLNGAIDRAQNEPQVSASTSRPVGVAGSDGQPNEGERADYSFLRNDLACAEPARSSAPPCRGSGSTTDRKHTSEGAR